MSIFKKNQGTQNGSLKHKPCAGHTDTQMVAAIIFLEPPRSDL
jgi:hypothetical protein